MGEDATMRGRLDAWFEGHAAELKLTLQITVAGLLTFALAHLFDLAQGFWAVLTAVIVVQRSVGGSLKASLDRLVSTLGGCAYGVAVAVAIPHGEVLSAGFALAAALAPLAFLTAIWPSYRIAPVTAVIVLLASSSQAPGALAYGADRVLEIGLGCIVGLGVSLLMLPARAHGICAAAAGRLLGLLAELVPMILTGLSGTRDKAALQRLNDRIRSGVAQLDALAEEARRERASRLTNEPDPQPLVRTIRRLRNDLIMLGRATEEPLPASVGARLSAPLAGVAVALDSYLRASGRALASGSAPPPLEPVSQALTGFATAIDAVRSAQLTRNLPSEAVARVFALIFALEHLHTNFEDLGDRISELSRSVGRR